MTWSPLAEVFVVVAAGGAVALGLTYAAHSLVTIATALAIDRIAPLTSRDRVYLWRGALIAPFVSATVHVAAAWRVSPTSAEWSVVAPAALVGPGVALAVIGLGLVPMIVTIGGIVQGRLALRRTLGRRVPIQGTVRDRLDSLAPPGLATRIRLTASDRLAVPAAVGRSEICVPGRLFATLPADEQRALLAHEIGHLAHRDPAWLWLASTLARLGCVQPLNVVAMRRLREATEQAADDFAVRTTRNPLALARALSSLAALVVFVAGAASATGSPIVVRAQRLLCPRPPRARRHRIVGMAAAAAVGVWLFTSASPGVRLDPSEVANRISWLQPSREAPNARMLEVRAATRALRHALRDTVR